MTDTTRAPRHFKHALLAAAAGALLLSGCATGTSPATGRTFSTPISAQQETQLGAQEHPKIIAEFGGVYDEKPGLNAYVTSIGQFLASTGEQPDLKFTFTLLNSPDVNAFALPGGYVYVTRGLMALANNEAEFAGVVGHEIGHVNARHTAERMGKQQQASILGTLGVLAGGILFGQQGANLAGGIANESIANYLGSYSQEQEFEADMLGVRYLKRATYDPQAMSTFLASLDASSRLDAQLAGQNPNVVDEVDMKRSHPRTQDRVQRAIQEAGGPQANAMLERDIYLSKIDGIVYGDDPSQGVVRDRLFVHPPLRFAFEVPSGYKLINQPDVVAITGPKGTLGNLSLANPQPSGSLTAALQNYDPKGQINLQGIQSININGMDAATGAVRLDTKSGPADYRAVLIRHPDGKVYEFVFLSLASHNGRYDADFEKTAYSFRQISASEAAQYNKPQRIRVVTVQSGDTIQSLSAKMVVPDAKEQLFRVLNALEKANSVQAGQKVKIVTY